MPSPLTKLAGATPNFSKSRVDLNETAERPVAKLLTRDIYEVERVCRRGPPFSLSDLVSLSVVRWDDHTTHNSPSARIHRRSEEHQWGGYR